MDTPLSPYLLRQPSLSPLTVHLLSTLYTYILIKAQHCSSDLARHSIHWNALSSICAYPSRTVSDSKIPSFDLANQRDSSCQCREPRVQNLHVKKDVSYSTSL